MSNGNGQDDEDQMPLFIDPEESGMLRIQPFAMPTPRIIDWEKVETLDDIKKILKALGCVFYDDGSEAFEGVRPYYEDLPEQPDAP